MSPNYFPGLVEASETAWREMGFCGGYRGIVSFSTGFRDSIEDMASQVAKVSCFTTHYGTPPGNRPRLAQEVLYS